MAFSYKVGSIVVPAATGNQATTGVGFQPEALIFWCNARTADAVDTTGAANRETYSFGFGVSSTSRAAIGPDFLTDNTEQTNTKVITLQLGGSDIAAADLVSMDSDGFTLNWITISSTNGKNVIVNYIALGGTSLTNAAIKQLTAPASTGSQSYTGVGFKPDFILGITANDSTAPPDVNAPGTTAFWGVGAGTSSSARWTWSSSFNNTASEYERTAKVLAVIGDTVQAEADLTSMDADGFTLNWTTTNSGIYCWFLCLKGGNYFVSSTTQPTTTGNKAITGLGFLPAGEIFASFMETAATTVQSGAGGNNASFGAAQSSSARGVVNNHTKTGTHYSTLDRTKCIELYSDAGGSIAAAADFVSQDSNGFTVNFTTADSTTREIVYVAFGPGTGGGAVAAFISWKTMLGVGINSLLLGIGIARNLLFNLSRYLTVKPSW